MLIISFPRYEDYGLIGGYGDRIVGLISIYTIAKVLDKQFRIYWKREDITKIFETDSFFIDNLPKNIANHHLIDRQTLLKNYLIDNRELFEIDTIFYCNQEISQYLFKNKNYSHLNYLDNILESWQDLYSKILILKPDLVNEVEKLLENYKSKKIIGIQIRTGDIHILNNKGVNSYNLYNNVTDELREILENIKKNIEENEYFLFITSDYNEIYSIAEKVWLKEQIIYNNKPSYHLDRRINDSDFSKIFIDNYILSQKVGQLYISKESNYGRIAYLSSPFDNCFDLKCNKLEKKHMLSKHENIWI